MKNFIREHPVIKELVLYGFIGSLSAGLDALLFWIMNSKLGWNAYIVNFFSINLGITCSFLLNSYLNFKMTDQMLSRAVRFFAVGYGGLLLSMLLLYLGVEKLGLIEIRVKLISVVIVAMFQFILNKLITFKKKEQKNG